MICYVCDKETVEIVTRAICRMYNCDWLRRVPDSSIYYLDRYKDSNGQLDQCKVYNAVYDAILKTCDGCNAISKRHIEYTGISNDIDADGKKTLDVLLKYLAHIGEDPIYGTPFYWMVYSISREVATLVATGWYKYHISVR